MGSRGRRHFGYKKELVLPDNDQRHIVEQHSGLSQYSGKTKFPKDWDDGRIIRAVEETIDAPGRIISPIPPNERFQIERDFDTVTVRVSSYHVDGEAIFHSAYPLP